MMKDSDSPTRGSRDLVNSIWNTRERGIVVFLFYGVPERQDTYVIVVHHEVNDPAGLLDTRGRWSSPSTKHGEESQALIGSRQSNLISTTCIPPGDVLSPFPFLLSLVVHPFSAKERNSSGKWDPESARSADDVFCFLLVPSPAIYPYQLKDCRIEIQDLLCSTRVLPSRPRTPTPAVWSSYTDSMQSFFCYRLMRSGVDALLRGIMWVPYSFAISFFRP
ncbi:uncharacterized protein ARMOST_14310 [Armillaria ostoyae]|uniref:Uncharacterized protein n=1 Tax=Armillaria ostoyae TaxID=47428 RepID=A0A284RQ87_ARMOS|nr:uncharacterized protein ARMOST_14310 [Armillaria ostoyae]